MQIQTFFSNVYFIAKFSKEIEVLKNKIGKKIMKNQFLLYPLDTPKTSPHYHILNHHPLTSSQIAGN